MLRTPKSDLKNIFCFEPIKAWVILGFFVLTSLTVQSQTQVALDSLEKKYQSRELEPQAKLAILKELAINSTDTNKKLSFSEELVRVATLFDSTNYLIQGLQEKGNALRLKGDLTRALQSFLQAAKLVEEENGKAKLGALNIGIADVYSVMGNYSNAVSYYRHAIEILRTVNDSTNMAAALLNMGDTYITMHKWDSALICTEEAGVIYEKIQSKIGEAYSLGNLGMIYVQLGDDKKAERIMNKAIELLEVLNEYYPISVYLNLIADIYKENKEYQAALDYAFRSLHLAKKYGLKEQVSEANLRLSEIYQRMGKLNESFAYYKSHITYKDSLNNIKSVQQMADLRTNFEVSKKQIEVDLLNQQKKNQQIVVIATTIAILLLSMLVFGLYRRYKFIRETNQIIEQERQRSENLLLNILPKETAQELKANGRVQAKSFESVTVLFADFKGFTHYAEKMTPEKLVESVDFYFSRFDQIMERYGLEKIKTIGDSYMCAGGLPFPTQNHAHHMIGAALEIVDFVKTSKKTNPELYPFDIRVGVNTGSVVAGVVGTKKFAYDVWGDTVNVAARMESNSEPGRINISEYTYELVKDQFICTYRGEIDVKNRGMLKMYFVEDTISKNS